MGKTLLELIVIHTDEPWEMGKPLFDMIEYQRCTEPDSFQVKVVQAGAEGALAWDELLRGYSFSPRLMTVQSMSVADAKNVAIDNTDAEWIMFLSFKDMFADVCALSMMTEHLPTNDFDVIWGKYIVEQRWGAGKLYLQKVDSENFYTTDSKMYRTAFLREHRVRFDNRVDNYIDYIFNSLIMAETLPNRIAHLETPFYIYISKHVHISREDAKARYDAQIAERYRRDNLLSDMFRMRGKDFESNKKLVYIICSEYFRVYDIDDGTPDQIPSHEFMSFFRKHRDILNRISPLEIEAIKDEVETETMAMIQDFYNQHKLEYYLVNDTLSFDEWLQKIDQIANSTPSPAFVQEPSVVYPQERELKPVVIRNDPMVLQDDEYVVVENPPEDPAPQQVQDAREPRVAVYCGTYNTYLDILTSAKSLLWHTKMDKIYFLIEDDVFPYELPDNGLIECINVKNQKWFPETGPNYNNAWSYMCMMRAVFTKLIPYDKVLSLDIDVVVQEDISCLWDIDMTDYYLAGVEEPQRKKQSTDPLYINFGVVMMNLKKIRDEHIDDKIIDALNKTKFLCPEQDAFNQFCAHHIYRMPNDYNATIHSHITGDAEKERIVHFAGIRFWRHFGPIKEYGNRNWNLVLERQGELT